MAGRIRPVAAIRRTQRCAGKQSIAHGLRNDFDQRRSQAPRKTWGAYEVGPLRLAKKIALGERTGCALHMLSAGCARHTGCGIRQSEVLFCALRDRTTDTAVCAHLLRQVPALTGRDVQTVGKDAPRQGRLAARKR